MYRVACLFLACASSAACADNVKTLVIQGVATGPASLIVTSAPVECSTPLGAPTEHLLASVQSGDAALVTRDALIAPTARLVGISCGTSSGQSVTRVHVGDAAGVRFERLPDTTYKDFQLWISTDGVTATLLEPQVPVTVAGLTFTAYIGDPEVVLSAPAVGAVGLVVLAGVLTVVGAVLMARRNNAPAIPTAK